MRINDIILIIVAIALIGVVLFTLFRDKAEEEEFEQELNERDLC